MWWEVPVHEQISGRRAADETVVEIPAGGIVEAKLTLH